jgi:hypothetical protein
MQKFLFLNFSFLGSKFAFLSKSAENSQSFHALCDHLHTENFTSQKAISQKPIIEKTAQNKKNSFPKTVSDNFSSFKKAGRPIRC